MRQYFVPVSQVNVTYEYIIETQTSSSIYRGYNQLDNQQ